MARETRSNSKGIIIDGLDPGFEVSIEGTTLGAEITRFIKHVEYESADGIADMAKIVISNVDGIFTDSKMFQAGNEMALAFGYGTLSHVGRVELVKPRFSFPQGDIPTIELTGYTADIRMMDGKSPKAVKKKKLKKKEIDADLRIFQANPKLSLVLNTITGPYEFNLDYDELTLPFPKGLVQRPNTSDYDLIKGLANLTGFIFWVDGDEDGLWTLHFKEPNAKGIISDVQEAEYTFAYGHTLFSFDPEFSFRDVKTKLVVEADNPDNAEKPHRIEIEDEETAPDFLSDGDAESVVDKPILTGGSAKIYLGEFQIEVIPNKHFTKESELKLWAEQWFRRHREDFVNGSGTLIGLEDVFARQTHKLTGMGNTLDGRYYFARVRHTLNADAGYTMAIEARRVIE